MLDKLKEELKKERREREQEALERQKIEDRVNAVVKKAELKQYEEDLLRSKLENIKRKNDKIKNPNHDPDEDNIFLRVAKKF